MDETFITLSINKFLIENNYEVIQCIPPGAQGALYFSIKNKIIYPDIIAYKKNVFLVGENKSIFDESDEEKLHNLSLEENLVSMSERILKNYQSSQNINMSELTEIRFFLGFSFNKKNRSNKFDNYLVNNDGSVILLKNQNPIFKKN